jgi:O-antigen polymerase
MFLALTAPIFLFLLQSKYKKLYLTGFLTVLIALLLLKCRAAFIGAMASVIVFYGLEYNLIGWLKNKKNKITAKALLVLCLLIAIPTFSHLYNSKRASADGRKFIWKLSMEMIPQKPFFGYGYGFYSKEYNLFQADYIQKGKATFEEMENAAHVLMAHNDFIQNAVEGGIIGFILLLLFFGSLLFSLNNQNKEIGNEQVDKAESDPKTLGEKGYFNLSYSGIVAFVLMATINFSIQNIPVMSMLSFYTAIICNRTNPIRIPQKLAFIETNKTFVILSKISTISIYFYLIYTLIGIANADHLNKEAELLKKEGKYEQALIIMPKLEPYLNEDSDYWKNYGNLFYQLHDYPEAIRCLNKAQDFDTSPALYLGLGICNEKLEQFPTAIGYYTQLINSKPSKFAFRFRLMNAYLQNKDTVNSLKTAQGILDLKPKIPSKKVLYYKNKAQKLVSFMNNKKGEMLLDHSDKTIPSTTANFLIKN